MTNYWVGGSRKTPHCHIASERTTAWWWWFSAYSRVHSQAEFEGENGTDEPRVGIETQTEKTDVWTRDGVEGEG